MARVQSTSANTGGTTAASVTTPGITTTSGNLIAVGAGTGNAAPQTLTLGDNKSNAINYAPSSPAAGNSDPELMTFGYFKNINGGTGHTFTATFTTTNAGGIGVVELSGRDTTAPLAAHNSAGESTPATSHNGPAVTSPLPGLDVFMFGMGTTAAPGQTTAATAPWIKDTSASYVDGTSTCLITEYQENVGAGTYTPQFTCTNSDTFSMGTMAFKPAGALPVQSTGLQTVSGTAGPTTFNAPSNFTAGNSAIISLSHFAGAGNRIAGITVSGTAAVKDAEASESANTHAEIWRANNLAGGSSAIVITFAGGTDNYVSMSCDEWAGMAGGVDKTGTNTGTSTAPSATFTAPSQASEIAYAAFGFDATSTPSIVSPSGYKTTWAELDGFAHEGGGGAFKELTSATGESPAFACGSSLLWGAAVATYALGGGGGPVPTDTLSFMEV